MESVGYLARAISDLEADIDTGLSGIDRASGELRSVVGGLHWIAREIMDNYENTASVDRVGVEVRQHLDTASREIYAAADLVKPISSLSV